MSDEGEDNRVAVTAHRTSEFRSRWYLVATLVEVRDHLALVHAVRQVRQVIFPIFRRVHEHYFDFVTAAIFWVNH
jgi:hypothetical protein